MTTTRSTSNRAIVSAKISEIEYLRSEIDDRDIFLAQRGYSLYNEITKGDEKSFTDLVARLDAEIEELKSIFDSINEFPTHEMSPRRRGNCDSPPPYSCDVPSEN